MRHKQNGERPVLEAALETGEVIIDTVIAGDALADIPIIGLAIKTCRAFDSVRDKIFAAKIQEFLKALPDPNSKEWVSMKAKIESNPDEINKIGETLVLVLEQLTDFIKPKILANLFVCYIDGIINEHQLRRLAQAVNVAFVDDLVLILDPTKHRGYVNRPQNLEPLVPAGLAKIEVSGAIGNAGEVTYVYTQLGVTLHAANTHKSLL